MRVVYDLTGIDREGLPVLMLHHRRAMGLHAELKEGAGSAAPLLTGARLNPRCSAGAERCWASIAIWLER